MTWSISCGGASRAEAKRNVTQALAVSMLSQPGHARDFPMVLAAIHGAIDACTEGSVGVSATGYLTQYQGDDGSQCVTGLSFGANVWSTPE